MTDGQQTEEREEAAPAAAEAASRRARFGTLPERVRPEQTVETKPATAPDPARDRYDVHEWLIRYCG
ncbi:hypothetical protein C3489_23190 [Streptomyces sp. Ru71]|uniref:hypothetical protein n=1 Tax=Streptomyces sp. Ru71 TaxID=2080746 RepID=UPI000CDD6F5D|nr:hypothetical protein [Streptomyces sp. Ru71]POX50152.1 hypothetical protein C3489_23190 [Streptomyces sp. Ru71]